ncbi:MAG: hypothetical protein ABII23_07260 [bacterium]
MKDIRLFVLSFIFTGLIFLNFLPVYSKNIYLAPPTDPVITELLFTPRSDTHVDPKKVKVSTSLQLQVNQTKDELLELILLELFALATYENSTTNVKPIKATIKDWKIDKFLLANADFWHMKRSPSNYTIEDIDAEAFINKPGDNRTVHDLLKVRHINPDEYAGMLKDKITLDPTKKDDKKRLGEINQMLSELPGKLTKVFNELIKIPDLYKKLRIHDPYIDVLTAYIEQQGAGNKTALQILNKATLNKLYPETFSKVKGLIRPNIQHIVRLCNPLYHNVMDGNPEPDIKKKLSLYKVVLLAADILQQAIYHKSLRAQKPSLPAQPSSEDPQSALSPGQKAAISNAVKREHLIRSKHRPAAVALLAHTLLGLHSKDVSYTEMQAVLQNSGTPQRIAVQIAPQIVESLTEQITRNGLFNPLVNEIISTTSPAAMSPIQAKATGRSY